MTTETEARTCVVATRFTADEHALLTSRAEDAGLTLSELVRELSLAASAVGSCGMVVNRPAGKRHGVTSLKSPRMAETLRALENAGEAGLTSDELRRVTGTVAISTLVSELRRSSGRAISCEFERVTDAGSKVYRYRLA